MISVSYMFLILVLSSKSNFFISNLFSMDQINLPMLLLSLFTFLASTKFLFTYLFFNEKLYYNVLLFLIIYFIALSFLVNDMFMFLILFELVLFPLFFLVYNFSKGKDKILSVMFMILFNMLGSFPFMMFCYFFIDSSSYKESFLLNDWNLLDSYFSFMCFILIFLTKIPILFFHFWLPKAHGSSSGVCSMILASLVLKLGTFGLLKFSSLSLKTFFFSSHIFFSLSVISSVFFSSFMYRFFDMKYLVACSSVLHMSMISPCCLMSSNNSTYNSLFMMVGHGLISFFLFYLVTLIYESSQTRSASMNKSLESICKIFSLMFFFSIFLNLGIPPLINFLSEIGYCSVLMNFSFFSVFLICFSLITAVFFSIFISSFCLYGKKCNYIKIKTFISNLNLFISMLLMLVFFPMSMFSLSLN